LNAARRVTARAFMRGAHPIECLIHLQIDQ